MQEIKLIAFTHKTVGLENLGILHIEDDLSASKLSPLKSAGVVEEIMVISTCNRVEFLFVSSLSIQNVMEQLFTLVYSNMNAERKSFLKSNAIKEEGIHAVKHILKVASSLDSLVVGEREIITQVRNSYERAVKGQLCGDTLRLVIKKTIETAKQVYTETEIANRPVSVVNLAYRMLRTHDLDEKSKVIVVGAGKTNTAMLTQLHKHGIGKYFIYNRTLSKAESLAKEVNGEGRALTELPNHSEGFDLIITCTGSSNTMIDKALYAKILGADQTKKYVVDLAVPNDFDEEIVAEQNLEYISIKELKAIAEKNLGERQREVSRCESIIDTNIEEFEMLYRTRMIERAMQDVPSSVKSIKQRAVEGVFAKELEGLDSNSREVLDKVIAYMERKYISMPMKMAREIMLGEINKK